MNWHTEIPIEDSSFRLGYKDHFFFVGSCFSDHIAIKLLRYKYTCVKNPFGTYFHPIPLLNNLRKEVLLLNQKRDRIKIFKSFEDVSKPSSKIKAMEIQYACVYKRSSKLVIKTNRVESIEDARKEYKQLLEECWKQTSIFRSYF